MRFFVLMICLATSMGALFASSAIVCSKNSDLWEAYFHDDERHYIYGLQLNNNYAFNENGEYLPIAMDAGLKTYVDILKNSGKCNDISRIVGAEESEFLFQCEGEIFTTKDSVYGQVRLSVGALEVFKNTLAPASSWNCQYYFVRE